MKTSRENLVRRTVASRLSKLIAEVYELLEAVHPNTKNFAVLINAEEKEVEARILPLTSKEMNRICEASEKYVRYTAYTDEDNNFVRGEER